MYNEYFEHSWERNEPISYELNRPDQELDGGIGKLVTINQYAQEVVDFSSQYDNDNSTGYSVYNVTGKPCRYPDYGDFQETFAFRTYGPWWKQAPSAAPEFNQSNVEHLPAIDDYIVVRFDEPVIPEILKIFETFHPGAIVRIWAYTRAKRWFCLWDATSGEDAIEDLLPVEPNEARIFSPPLKTCPSPTRHIRLEFNHSRLEYPTQLDAVLLVGQKFIPSATASTARKEFVQELSRQNTTSSESHSSSRSQTPTIGELTLDQMPYDILFNIMSHLDLKSLYQCGRVCRTFQEIVGTDSLLYTEINLKPYWNCVSSAVLQSLKKRCAYMKKLDLSWCGLFNKITPGDLKDFLSQCGANLTHLRLNSCKFMTVGSCLEFIGANCFENLRELSLQNYRPGTMDFSSLHNFRNLERLDLSRTWIDTQSLLNVLARNENLRHLNLAFCSLEGTMDDVALQISKSNRQLVSLDMWKSDSLTPLGLAALSKCALLEEVDIGWCARAKSCGESVRTLVKGCPRLRKLFMAAIWGLTDRDLEVIATSCEYLEQLDVSMSKDISTEMCYRLLCRCRKLKLLDLSFCQNVDNKQIAQWRDCFDVDIKRSLVNLELYRSSSSSSSIHGDLESDQDLF